MRSLRFIAFLLVPALLSPLNATPVMFCTQTPHSRDFQSCLSLFGNHRGDVDSAPRGGDLYIRYDNGTLRNLTQEAGFGGPGMEIAVREPSIHWDGTKALVSIAVGGAAPGAPRPFFQIYEVTGFGAGQTVSFALLPQPTNYNNVSPCYGTDDRIIFTSDRPINGNTALYPLLDEYETAPSVSGLWSMAAQGTDLRMLDHAPSGDFKPMVDSFGRVIFTRWDHLQRDQQADGDINAIINGTQQAFHSVTFDSEAEDSAFHPVAPGDEVFPEARQFHPNGATTPHPVWDADHQADENGHTMNQFIPWACNEDGTDLETLNHLGRQEILRYIPASRTGKDSLYFFPTPHVDAFQSAVEDPSRPGYFYGINGPEFSTHGSGQLVGMDSPPTLNADLVVIDNVTHEDTHTFIQIGQTPNANQIGFFRDPMPKSDGTLWASYSTSPFVDAATIPDPGAPAPYPHSSRFDYRIVQLVDGPNGHKVPGGYLLPAAISKTVTFYDPFIGRNATYSGAMWEVYPVEVAARPRPAMRSASISDVERTMLEQELGGPQGIDELRQYLIANNLALVISRDVTRRADKQQDYNLKVAWSTHQSAVVGSTPKEIGFLQFFEGRLLRAQKNSASATTVRPGRRVLARPMDDSLNPVDPAAPDGAVRIGNDGSAAAFVPARRAVSFQTTEADGTPAVRERYWITFQPGEIRTCTNCHGVNTKDVLGNAAPANPPEALQELMVWWKSTNQGSASVRDWMAER